MTPTEPDAPLEAAFKEGLAAREKGHTRRDNPYAAGSRRRREWDAGFCATADREKDGDLALDPNDESDRRAPE